MEEMKVATLKLCTKKNPKPGQFIIKPDPRFIWMHWDGEEVEETDTEGPD